MERFNMNESLENEMIQRQLRPPRVSATSNSDNIRNATDCRRKNYSQPKALDLRSLVMKKPR